MTENVNSLEAVSMSYTSIISSTDPLSSKFPFINMKDPVLKLPQPNTIYIAYKYDFQTSVKFFAKR